MKPARLLLLAALIAGLFAVPGNVHAQSAAPLSNQITFDSFNGVYYLSRDSHGLSLLTTEETIVADFPAGGFYGIKRELPEKFKGRSVNVKILGVSDAAGNPVPYQTSSAQDNLTVTTGNPQIILNGSQTIKIKYQTSGVVNLGAKADEFLLNVNGRGWDQPIDHVYATLYLPSGFGAKLKAAPVCYTSLEGRTDSDCRVDTRKSDQATVITSETRSVAPHKALVVRLNFAPATFTDKHASRSLLVGAGMAALILAALLYKLGRNLLRGVHHG